MRSSRGRMAEWRRGAGGRVEENVKVEGDIFSGCNVGPWQFCHACFSQDLCPTVPPFNGGASCLLHGYYRPDAGGVAPRRSTSYRPITVWPFRQRDAAHEIPEASPTTTTTMHAGFRSTSRCVASRRFPWHSGHYPELALYREISDFYARNG